MNYLWTCETSHMQKWLKIKIAKYCTPKRLETWLSFQKDAGNLESCLVLALLKLIIDKSIPTACKENQESVEIERYSMTGEV